MKSKLTASELLRLACHKADEYEETFLQSISHCTDRESADVRAWSEGFLKQLRAYRRKRWGKKAAASQSSPSDT